MDVCKAASFLKKKKKILQPKFYTTYFYVDYTSTVTMYKAEKLLY